MNHSQPTCQPRQIELFLRQQLSDTEQSAFELHLGTCGDCQRALEMQTARAEVWATVRESLSSDEFPVEYADDSHGSGFVESATSSGFEEAAGRFQAVLGFLSPTDDPRMLGRLGAYEIVGIVGQGGMGVVLKGLDPALSRYVAIKVLAPHLAASGSARRRFAREAQAAAAVTHENVVAIHGVAEWNGLPYLVMPYVRGESLQKRLDQLGPLGLNEVLRVGRQVAAGLAAAHAQGLVHRDIKPANILLEDGVERLQITDFGLARAVDDASLTRTGVIAGTPQFMSPEQARGEVIDARSDLFSLGSTLYALCTGRPPFRAETSYGILRRITDNEPRPIREINPEIPDWLAAIINKLLAKRLEERFSEASDVAAILEQCLAHVRQPTVLPLPRQVAELVDSTVRSEGNAWTWQRVSNVFRQHRATWLRGLAVGLLLCGTMWAGIYFWSRNRHAGVQAPHSGVQHMGRVNPGTTGVPSDTSIGTAWDETALEVRDLLQDSQPLKSQAERLWDMEPIPQPEQSATSQRPVTEIEATEGTN